MSAIDLRKVGLGLLLLPLFGLGAWNHAANGTSSGSLAISILMLVLLALDAFLCGAALATALHERATAQQQGAGDISRA